MTTRNKIKSYLVYLQTLTVALGVKYRIKYQFLVLAAIILLPLSSYSNSIDPKKECLSTRKTKEGIQCYACQDKPQECSELNLVDQESCDKHNMGWNGCLANLYKAI